MRGDAPGRLGGVAKTIMRIDPRTAPPAIGAAVRPQQAARTRFSLDDKPTASAGAARAAAPLATLDAILQLQAEEDPGQRRRRSARRGQDMLDALDRVKVGLLSGTVPASELGRLARALSGAGASGDPGLDALVAQIELRAKVELAKLGRSDLI